MESYLLNIGNFGVMQSFLTPPHTQYQFKNDERINHCFRIGEDVEWSGVDW